MAVPLEMSGCVPLQRQKSLQSNILFMQQDHSTTLKALHEEIQRLQKKCSELTFSVAMGTTSSPQEDFYRNKSEELEKELSDTLKRLKDVQVTADKKDKRITTLEQQLRAQEKKYQDLIKNKEQQLRLMKLELSEKAKENANLMYKQLASSHNSGLYRVVTSTDQDLMASIPVTSTSGAPPVPPLKGPITPHPPRDSGSGRRRRSPRTIVADSEPVRSANGNLRSATLAGRALRHPKSPDTVPVPAVFLDHQPDEQLGTYPTTTAKYSPLPPITASAKAARQRRQTPEGSRSRKEDEQARPFTPKQRKSLHNKGHSGKAKTDPSSDSSSPEVEVLAVDTVIKRDQKLQRAQEYN